LIGKIKTNARIKENNIFTILPFYLLLIIVESLAPSLCQRYT